MAILVILVSITEFFWNAANPTDRDFISFWGAAQLALAGDPAAAYDQARLHEVQSAVATFVNGDGMPFPYPPAFLLLVTPFGLLPFAVSLALWSAATFAVYFVVVRRMFPQSGWLAAAFPPVFINAAIGQNAFVTAAIFIGGMLLLAAPAVRRRPAAGMPGHQAAAWIAPAHRPSRGPAMAGDCGCGHFLPRPSGRRSRRFRAAATEAWLAQMPLYVNIGRDGLVGWHKMASVYAALRQAGAGLELAFAVHLLVAAVAGHPRLAVSGDLTRKRRQRLGSSPPRRCSRAPMSFPMTRFCW